MLDSSTVDCLIKFKTTSDQDPFLITLAPFDSSSSSGIKMHTNYSNLLMNSSPLANQVAGQIVSYTSLVMGAQYCTHLFTVLILKQYARLIQWDRGGALVMVLIYFNTESYLLDFLIRFNNLTPAAHGHDLTVCVATDSQLRRAQALQPFAKASLLTVTITNHSRMRGPSPFIICTPYAQPYIPVGHWT